MSLVRTAAVGLLLIVVLAVFGTVLVPLFAGFAVAPTATPAPTPAQVFAPGRVLCVVQADGYLEVTFNVVYDRVEADETGLPLTVWIGTQSAPFDPTDLAHMCVALAP